MNHQLAAAIRMVLVWVACLGGVAGAVAAPVSIKGEVTYRERIALPTGARLTVKLIDVTDEEARIVVEAVAAVTSRGQIPLQYNLSFDDSLIAAGRSYGLSAEISTAEGLWFRNALPQPVDPLAAQSQLLIVSFVGQLIDPTAPNAGKDATPPGRLQVSAGLTDTIWIGDRIGGRAASQAGRTTLSIAADRRAGGTAPCNSYFAEAAFDGPELTFGAIVATRRVCTAAVMDEERRYFTSLARVRGYRLDGEHLFLLDAQGTRVLRFRLAK